MPAIMMADPGRQGPGPGESKGVYGHFGSPADEHQREAEHLRRMQVTNALLDKYIFQQVPKKVNCFVKLKSQTCHSINIFFFALECCSFCNPGIFSLALWCAFVFVF